MTEPVKVTYPPLARQANITGEVELRLELRGDGSVESAVVVSGPPLLQQAALDSAMQSRFECRACRSKAGPHLFTYSFNMVERADPCQSAVREARVMQSPNRTTISAEALEMIVDFASVRVRSAKCLYLWRCGLEWGGEDYYYYRVRSAKCLGLWECGRRLREPFATCKQRQKENRAN